MKIVRQSTELAIDRVGADASAKLQSGFIYATQPGGAATSATEGPRGLNAVNVKPPNNSPAAIVSISDQGRAALAAAQPPTPPSPGGQMVREMTTGADWDYRVYGPGHAHWGAARSTPGAAGPARNIEIGDSSTGSDQFHSTTPGHKSIEPISLRSPAPAIREAQGYALYSIQKSVRLAVSDIDRDGLPDVAAAGPPAGDIQAAVQKFHDMSKSIIGNIRA